MRCPYCKFQESRVVDTTHDSRGGVRRRRECEHCGQRFSTYERPILATPLIVKQDNSREEFDRDKLIRGIRISCAKRPVSATDIERLVGEIETTLQSLGRAGGFISCRWRFGHLWVKRPGPNCLYPLCNCLSGIG